MCSYWIEESTRTVRCDSIATLNMPVCLDGRLGVEAKGNTHRDGRRPHLNTFKLTHYRVSAHVETQNGGVDLVNRHFRTGYDRHKLIPGVTGMCSQFKGIKHRACIDHPGRRHIR